RAGGIDEATDERAIGLAFAMDWIGNAQARRGGPGAVREDDQPQVADGVRNRLTGRSAPLLYLGDADRRPIAGSHRQEHHLVVAPAQPVGVDLLDLQGHPRGGDAAEAALDGQAVDRAHGGRPVRHARQLIREERPGDDLDRHAELDLEGARSGGSPPDAGADAPHPRRGLENQAFLRGARSHYGVRGGWSFRRGWGWISVRVPGRCGAREAQQGDQQQCDSEQRDSYETFFSHCQRASYGFDNSAHSKAEANPLGGRNYLQFIGLRDFCEKQGTRSARRRHAWTRVRRQSVWCRTGARPSALT